VKHLEENIAAAPSSSAQTSGRPSKPAPFASAIVYGLPAKQNRLTTRGDSKGLAAARLNRLCVFDDPVTQFGWTVLLDFECQGVVGQKSEFFEVAMLLDIPIGVADATWKQPNE
jgi:hypothetical protein